MEADDCCRVYEKLAAAAVVGALGAIAAPIAGRLADAGHTHRASLLAMLFAALIGGHLLGEGDRLARVCGAVCIAAGVTALALG